MECETQYATGGWAEQHWRGAMNLIDLARDVIEEHAFRIPPDGQPTAVLEAATDTFRDAVADLAGIELDREQAVAVLRAYAPVR
jgi:hypothetical protein